MTIDPKKSGRIDLGMLDLPKEEDESSLPLAAPTEQVTAQSAEACQGIEDVDLSDDDADGPVDVTKPTGETKTPAKPGAAQTPHFRPLVAKKGGGVAEKEQKWVAWGKIAAVVLILLGAFYTLSAYNVTQRKQSFIRKIVALREQVSQVREKPTEKDVIAVSKRLAEETGCKIERIRVTVEPFETSSNIGKLPDLVAARGTATNAQWILGIKALLSARYGISKKTFNHEYFTYLYYFDAPHPDDDPRASTVVETDDDYGDDDVIDDSDDAPAHVPTGRRKRDPYDDDNW